MLFRCVPVTDEARDVNGADSHRNQNATADEQQADDGRDVNGVDYEATSTSRNLSFREQWSYLLANDSANLKELFPDAHVQAADGRLQGLKTEKWNGHPVIIHNRIGATNRFSVTPFNYTTRQPLSIKQDNIVTLKTAPASTAFERFKANVHPKVWDMLSDDNPQLLQTFVEFQFPCFDADTKCYTFLHVAQLNDAYTDLFNDTLREVRSQGLKVTKNECAIVISFLYSLAFSRKLHIVRSFSISPTWVMRKWKGKIDLHLPMPP